VSAEAGLARVRPAVLVAFQAAFFAISLNLVIIAPLLPALATAFQRPVGDLGLLVTAFALPYALLAPFLGPASDRLGRRALVLTGLGLFTAGQALAVVAPTLPVLLAARAIVGVGAAAFTPAAYAYLTDHSPPARRAATISAVLLAATIGSIVGLPLGGLAVALAGWQGAFGLLGCLGLLAIGLLWLSLERDRPVGPVRRGYLRELADVLRAPGTRLTLTVTMLWSIGYNGALNYTGVLMADRYQLSTEQIAVLMTGLGVGGLVGNRLGAWAGPRLGDRRMIVTAMAALLVAIVALPALTPAPLVTVAIAAVLPGVVQFGWPALLSFVSDLVPRGRATALALNNSAYYLGGAIGPPLVGAAISALGIDAMALPAAAAVVAALALAVRWLPRPRAGS
jgi:predicted MFS family arabinose efflux permease